MGVCQVMLGKIDKIGDIFTLAFVTIFYSIFYIHYNLYTSLSHMYYIHIHIYIYIYMYIIYALYIYFFVFYPLSTSIIYVSPKYDHVSYVIIIYKYIPL